MVGLIHGKAVFIHHNDAFIEILVCTQDPPIQNIPQKSHFHSIDVPKKSTVKMKQGGSLNVASDPNKSEFTP